MANNKLKGNILALKKNDLFSEKPPGSIVDWENCRTIIDGRPTESVTPVFDVKEEYYGQMLHLELP